MPGVVYVIAKNITITYVLTFKTMKLARTAWYGRSAWGADCRVKSQG